MGEVWFLQRVRIARNADRCHSTGCLSVCLSICLSVKFRCFVQMNEDTIMWFSASDRTIILVSGEVKFVWIFTGDHS